MPAAQSEALRGRDLRQSSPLRSLKSALDLPAPASWLVEFSGEWQEVDVIGE